MSEAIRAAVIDDEPMARRILRDLLAADPEVELVAEGAAAGLLGELPGLDVQLLFLDVEMPEVSGFELLDRLGTRAEPAGGGVRHRLRPLRGRGLPGARRRLPAQAVHRRALRRRPGARQSTGARARQAGRRGVAARDAHPAARGGAGAPRVAGAERLLVRVGERSVVVPVADIDWIEAADYYARLHCGEPLLPGARVAGRARGGPRPRAASAASIAPPSCASIGWRRSTPTSRRIR